MFLAARPFSFFVPVSSFLFKFIHIIRLDQMSKQSKYFLGDVHTCLYIAKGIILFQHSNFFTLQLFSPHLRKLLFFLCKRNWAQGYNCTLFVCLFVLMSVYFQLPDNTMHRYLYQSPSASLPSLNLYSRSKGKIMTNWKSSLVFKASVRPTPIDRRPTGLKKQRSHNSVKKHYNVTNLHQQYPKYTLHYFFFLSLMSKVNVKKKSQLSPAVAEVFPLYWVPPKYHYHYHYYHYHYYYYYHYYYHHHYQYYHQGSDLVQQESIPCLLP